MCLAKVKVISTQKNRSRDVLIREKPSKFDLFIGCKVKWNDVTTVPVTTIKGYKRTATLNDHRLKVRVTRKIGA